jgi:alkanesulfonate monooxygenase SsuD/methylene tetrahydromethanopterin reductase-like flavin-dependent oxidoreductase (luciferase family)
MIGTTSKRMLELTVKHADQWNVWLGEIDNDVRKLAALVPGVDAACVAAGRDPATLERSAAVHIEVGPPGSATLSEVPLRGTPEELAAHLRAYAEIGVSHLQICPEPTTIAGIETLGRVLEVLDRG